jgi:hypothetical protein
MAGAALVAVLFGTTAAMVVAAPRPSAERDSDADGLPDVWELEGVALDGGAGTQWIDLPAMGADPNQPDLFVQIDWMADATHDQRPRPEAIRRVIDAFARAPVTSPTGSVGIALHVDAGPESPLDARGARWGGLSRARPIPWQDNLGSAATGTYDWSAFEALKRMSGGFVESGRAAVFHYAMFAYYHDRDSPGGGGASGIARGIGGTDLLITLGNFTDGVGNVQEQAGTFMHELGHNLGLRHGGCDDQNLKPGYASVMNYVFQMEGLVRGGVHGIVDYARGAPPVLDEAFADPPADLLEATATLPLAPSCVAPGREGAGIAGSLTLGPGTDAGPAAHESTCGEGPRIDDWQAVRLRVGSIGRLDAR